MKVFATTLLARRTAFIFLAVAMSLSSFAQQPQAKTVPHLVNFSGTVPSSDGHAHSSIAGLTFALYKDADGGVPLWIETQNVQLDAKGHYTVQLGASKPDGIPVDLFTSGEARWLGVRPEGLAEQPRVLLVSVPYALKAADAETIGGRPASAFVLAPSADANVSATSSSSVSISTAAITGTGTTNFLPLWTSASALGSSTLFQSGTGAAAKIGIGTTTPTSTLDVKGAATVRGIFSLPAIGIATATAGSNSQPLAWVASAFNSGTKKAINETFQWKAEPAANNTAAPSGTLNLLFSAGTTVPAETGLKIASNGQITFATGQTFPGGSGSGTVTSVALTAPSSDFTITGSPVTKSGALGLNWTIAPTSALIANTIVKRDSLGGFQAFNISANGKLAVGGPAVFGGTVGIGTSTPQAVLNVNQGPNSNTFLVGSTTKGIMLSDTGAALDLESLGKPLFINNGSKQPVYLFGGVGISTFTPQALLNVNQGASLNTFLVGSTSKGIILRDTGTALDLESLGAPLYINNTTTQPLLLNASGGPVSVGTSLPNSNIALTVGISGNNLALQTFGGINVASGGIAIANGNELINGDLNVLGTKNFRIDHPLDPANKYLKHAAIESSEVLNMYTGNVRLDAGGEAAVQLPDWFDAVNADFRYQLTAVGAPGPNLYVAQEIENNVFRIAGGTLGMKVSWQITCLRSDPYMKAHPFVVEEDKPASDVGYYDHPELYGQPAEKGLHSPEHAAAVRKLKTSDQP